LNFANRPIKLLLELELAGPLLSWFRLGTDGSSFIAAADRVVTYSPTRSRYTEGIIFCAACF
jgi:hypothetical protein